MIKVSPVNPFSPIGLSRFEAQKKIVRSSPSSYGTHELHELRRIRNRRW